MTIDKYCLFIAINCVVSISLYISSYLYNLTLPFEPPDEALTYSYKDVYLYVVLLLSTMMITLFMQSLIFNLPIFSHES